MATPPSTSKSTIVLGQGYGELGRYVKEFMKSLQHLIVLFSLVMTGDQARAEALHPQGVIILFFEALQKNDMEGLKKYLDFERVEHQARHNYNVEKLKALFADLDASLLQFSKPVYDKTTKIVRIRLVKPLLFDFDVQHQNAFEGKGDFYLIVGIHPR